MPVWRTHSQCWKVQVFAAQGAGNNLAEAGQPVVIEIEGKGRLVVFAFGSTTSGIPLDWMATAETPGVNLLKDFSNDTVNVIKEQIGGLKNRRHRGGFDPLGQQLGYEIPSEQRQFAHALIDQAGVEPDPRAFFPPRQGDRGV